MSGKRTRTAHSTSKKGAMPGHCAPCPRGIDIPTVNKFHDLAALHDEVPDSVREHYRALEVTADACIACRACEARCPFGVKVADKMARAVELFGC